MFHHHVQLGLKLVLALSVTALVAPSARVASAAEVQQGAVSGRVTNAATGEPIAGATLVVVGTSRGAVSGSDGRFSITGVPAGTHRVRVSMIGYGVSEQNVVVGGAPVTLDVTLRSEAVALEGVVAIGYGTQRRKDVTGAVGSVKMDGVDRRPTASIEQAIQGRVAGVQVTQASNAPGGGISMRIRGTGTITGNAEPLYVVDGLPIENDVAAANPGQGGRSQTVPPNPLSGLNPNDIESVEILKDASSTAIYGARGSNGVVLITTKRGRTARPTFTFNAYTGLQDVTKKIDVLGAREFAQFLNVWAPIRGWGPPPFPDVDNLPAQTDWQDEIFQQAPLQNYQMSVAGATLGENRTRYAVSGGVYDQEGVVIGSEFKRYSARLNLDQQVGPRFNLGMNLAVNRANTRMAATDGDSFDQSSGAVSAALQFHPTMPIKRADGAYTIVGRDTPPLIPIGEVANPVSTVLEPLDKVGHTQILGNLFAEYEVLKGLRARGSLGTNSTNRFRDTYWPRETTFIGASNGGLADRGRIEALNWVGEGTLNYDRRFGDAHAVTVLGGYTRELSESTNQLITNSSFVSDATGFNDIGAGNREGGPTVASGAVRMSMESYLGRLNYTLLDRYLFTLTGRYDGSSRFGAGNKWGFFPSGAVAWRVSSEPFLRDVAAISDLKLRASYGVSGNTAIRPYGSLTRMDDRRYSMAKQVVIGYEPAEIGNPDLSWESTYQLDIGADLALFDNRVNVAADWYTKRTEDLLLAVTMPLETGFGSVMRNAGAIQNRGVELTVGLDVLTGDGNESPAWTTNFNFARNRNVVLDLGPLREIIGPNHIFGLGGSRVRVGQPIGFFFGYIGDGIQRDSLSALADPVKLLSATSVNRQGNPRFVDMNGDNVVNAADRAFMGSPHPDFTLGWENTVGFRGFELSSTLQGVYGNEVLNMLRLRLHRASPQFNIYRDRYLNSWSPDNKDAKYPVLLADPTRLGGEITNWAIEDGSFLRLRSATLAYDVPTAKVRLDAFSRARLYVTGSNLLTWTKYTGYNPDVSSLGTGALNAGVDTGAYPLAKSVTIGIDITY